MEQKFVPQFKSKRFRSEKVFNVWLDNSTKYQIEFYDNGQDLLKIWVHSSGEILHCNLQSGIWNGKFINVHSIALKPTNYLEMYFEDRIGGDVGFRVMKFQIQKIITIDQLSTMDDGNKPPIKKRGRKKLNKSLKLKI